MKNNKEIDLHSSSIELIVSPETETITYKPNSIDHYIVIVKDVNDWEEIHNYIINENEIDGIPNRKVFCENTQEFSLRSAIYLMSLEEADLLRSHPKIESVELDPEYYPQPQSLFSLRFKRNIAINKPVITSQASSGTVNYSNGIRGNWSHLFVNNPTSLPFRGVGIGTTSLTESDLSYSLTGKNVDAVIIDSGLTPLHPEFFKEDGTNRVKDIILDGPYKVDPEYFQTNNLTYTKIVDGVNLGVGIATTSAHNWWGNTNSRSAKFSSLGTLTISSLYTLGHTATKTVNSNNNQLVDGHGTACASQIGGKSFGLAFDCNLWGIRILLGGVGGIIDASVALNACAIFHNAKKLSQNGDPDPTLINNSWGQTSSCPNVSGTVYTHGYRGQTLTYVGTGSDSTRPANSGSCRNHKRFTVRVGGTSSIVAYSGSGQYTPVSSGANSNSAAENAISAGCIVVASAGNQNQKFSDVDDIDYDNWFSNSSTYINRVGGVQKGGANVEKRKQGSIRVGALDCAVEPAGQRQGVSAFSIRKVVYSNNGPMINVWAPAELTMSAGYTESYESYIRNDGSGFYDTWFNGTSSAGPNSCSVIGLYLESNRRASQNDVHEWLENIGSIEINLSDPYPDPNSDNYWSQDYNGTADFPDLDGDSYNIRGNGNLRGSIKRVLTNPYANNTNPSMENVNISGISFSQS
jgi:hypothetical protein